ncbi:RAMP superfamily CRISPR-associated protein [Velocimicrobium porci]|uniref:CRISPR type III-associated protein domain-containing protein n=1 Tax=Velocimicrobium porci TaxID=2606634 RepID=A0A6L5XYD5_9FIRM|nr:RAMP superfamily CRISPR-associated protein [Velocimicrobium porci]MSS63639.1 hypothetical protein [Velocimicrobium porci]
MKQKNRRKKNSGNRICGRFYIIIKGKLESPVLIGSGEDENSDYDVILDSEGNPFFPGSSVAGAMRSYLKKVIEVKRKSEKDSQEKIEFTKDALEDLFGVEQDDNSFLYPAEKERQSRLYVYDAKLEDAQIIKRDGICLNEYKTTQDMGKFDLQAVSAGASFILRFEVIQRQDNLQCDDYELETALEAAQKKDLKILELAIQGIMSGELRLGGKSHRGFGKLTIEEMNLFPFNMMKQREARDWLSWDWEEAYESIAHTKNGSTEKGEKCKRVRPIDLESDCSEENQTEHKFVIPLEIEQTLLVRQYEDLEFGEKMNLNCRQLQMDMDKKKYAVIPGSTWAGAVRSKIASLVLQVSEIGNWESVQSYLDIFFGTWKQDNPLNQSKLVFEESIVDGGKPLSITRNAVDRFTGGTVLGALFTEEIWVGGQVNLTVRWSKNVSEENTNIICGLLYIVAKELQNGFLSVGGETSVGRGTFRSAGEIKFDGALFTNEKLEKGLQFYTKKALNWCKGQEEEDA